MYAYDHVRLSATMRPLLEARVDVAAWSWLETEAAAIVGAADAARLNAAFARMPRKTGKELLNLSPAQAEALANARPGLVADGWTVDRFARVWLLMQVPTTDSDSYFAHIENLFLAAEMGEQVALYSALPVLAWPERWRKRCAEGIRSNIGEVLRAVMCQNPYPAEQLEQDAWNQLVLKALFTDQPLLEIVGLRDRRNEKLARSLHDYAHERWAAHRDLNPLVWICMAPFVDEGIFSDVRRLFTSGSEAEQHAAALVCYETSFPPAGELLEQKPGIRSNIENGTIRWETVARLQNS